MISYSDYVLAEKPWAYWPMNDPSLYGMYNEPHSIIDVSGNGRHLTAGNNNTVGYKVTFTSGAESNLFPRDSLPIQGMSVNGSKSGSFYSMMSESNAIYLSTSTNAHINDVENELTYPYTHQLFRRKVRAEFLLDFPIPQTDYSCSPNQYPILTIGGMTLWMNTIWFRPCDNCACIEAHLIFL